MRSNTRSIQILGRSPALGKAIKRCRVERDMLVSELAKLLGRNATFINQVESAEIAIDTQTLEDCAAAFDISVVELLEMAISSPG